MRRHLFAFATIGLAFAGACATGHELEPDKASLAQQACEAQCDCLACSDSQLDKCESDMDILVEAAEDKNCDQHLDAYLECIGDAECQGTQLDTAECGQMAAVYNACMDSAPACSSVGDGTCDEPEGTGTCPEGTDIADCVGNGVCPTQNNGVCDEPGVGNGTCPLLSDIADCTGGTCSSTYDGTCDEPEGTGICPEGSDTYDCTATGDCTYPGDGICDEPEGTGICAEGTDPLDCGGSGSCSSCYEYGYEGAVDPLCAGSVALWDAVSNCICSYGCPSECSGACSGGSADSYCQSCMDTYCASELQACYDDI